MPFIYGLVNTADVFSVFSWDMIGAIGSFFCAYYRVFTSILCQFSVDKCTKNCWKSDHFTKEKRKLFEMTWNIEYFKILITFHKNELVAKNNRLGLVCVAVTILPTLIISVTNHQSSIKVTFLESALNYKLTVSHSMCASVHGELQKWNLYFVTGGKANTTCPNALSHQCRHRIPTSKKIKATFTTWVFLKIWNSEKRFCLTFNYIQE